jgi:hypothetical protein
LAPTVDRLLLKPVTTSRKHEIADSLARLCEGFSDADQAQTDELFPAEASERRQGGKSRGGAAVWLAEVYGEWMLSVDFVAVACRGSDA